MLINCTHKNETAEVVLKDREGWFLQGIGGLTWIIPITHCPFCGKALRGQEVQIRITQDRQDGREGKDVLGQMDFICPGLGRQHVVESGAKLLEHVRVCPKCGDLLPDF